jgi:hypothetical protein
MVVKIHIFLSTSCGWCRKQLTEIDGRNGFQELSRLTGVPVHVYYTQRGFRNQFFDSQQGVPQFAVEENNKIVTRHLGYIPGGVRGIKRSLGFS